MKPSWDYSVRPRGRAIPLWTTFPRFTKFVPCEVDLHPCYVRPNVGPSESGSHVRDSGGYAHVSVFQLYGPDQAIDGRSELWRVCIWGADDTGFENDVATMEEALAIFNAVQWIDQYPEGNGWHYA